jgi:predicted permease
MSLLHRLAALWRNLTHAGAVERDLDEELRAYLELAVAEKVKAGMDPVAARRAALIDSGGMTQLSEGVRAARAGSALDSLRADIRFAVRMLAKRPGFTLVVIAVLALAIGANTAIFSAVDAAMLRPLPFPDPERLVDVRGVELPVRIPGRPEGPKVDVDYFDLRAAPAFAEVAVYAEGGLNLGGGAEPQRVDVALATPSLFRMLGARPRLGRTFTEAEGAHGALDVVVLSDDLWHRQFGADPSIIGTRIQLHGRSYEVIGVMAERFSFPASSDLWVPLPVPFDVKRLEAFRQFISPDFVARLAPGVSREQAIARLQDLWRPLLTDGRSVSDLEHLAVVPLQERLAGSHRTPLIVLMGSTLLVLLIACANVANLMLASAAHRQREIALRVALGATRARLVRQMLTESGLLALAGALAGVLVAWMSLGALRTLMPATLAAVAPARLDARVLAFSLALAAGTALLFGVWPALRATHGRETRGIRTDGPGAVSMDAPRVRNILVVSELALAVMLVTGAGLMLRSFRALMDADLGATVEHVATMELNLPPRRYPHAAALSSFVTSVRARLGATPGIEAAGAVNSLPLRRGGQIAMRVQSLDDSARWARAEYLRVSPGYFEAMGIPLLRGRALTERDDSLAGVVMLNNVAARQLWPDSHAIGKRLTMMGRTRTVVGVVGDVRTSQLAHAPEPQLYVPILELAPSNVTFVARGAGNEQALLGRMRDAVLAVDRDQPVYNLQMMDRVVAASVAPRRTNTLLITIFGSLALALAALGIYGVISYGVSRRRREIGIRVALGAQQSSVVGMIMRQGLSLALIGIAIGLGGAYWLTRLLESLLYGVTARDPMTFIGAPVVLLIVALGATLIPARRATQIDPMEAIRTE